jgi:hypothetical protein
MGYPARTVVYDYLMGIHVSPLDQTSVRLLPMRAEKGNAPILVTTGGALNQSTDF